MNWIFESLRSLAIGGNLINWLEKTIGAYASNQGRRPDTRALLSSGIQ